MARYVKLGTLGGYKDVPGGQSDPECTHVILKKKEFEQQIQKISMAEQEARNAKYDADREIRQVRSDAQSRVTSAEAEADQRVKALEQELAKAQKEAEYQQGLNANLLRISRERANAERKLRPKKEHTGYFVVVTNEKDYRFKVSRHQWNQVRVWETVLQSPYPVDFTEEQARKQIWEDLFGVDKSCYLLRVIGIMFSYGKQYEEMIKIEDWDTKYKGKNIALRSELKLRANFRAGYWEASFLHTKPLEVVPPEMRVR